LINEGIIEIDTESAKQLGFTSDKFHQESYLWRTGNLITVSFIFAKQKGAFCQLMKVIQEKGFDFEIPTPSPRMREIGKKQNWNFCQKISEDFGEVINVLTNKKEAGMDKALFSTGNTEWETPKEFFDILNGILKFDVDVCATAANTKCERYFTKEIDGLTQDWIGRIWCNPPYGRDIGKWISRARDSYWVNDATVVMLLPSRTDTKWIHKYVFGSAHVVFLEGRLKFTGSKCSAPFPSMLAIWDNNKKRVAELAKNIGGYAVINNDIGGRHE